MSLRLARKQLSGPMTELVDAALDQVQAGLRDLRDLAAGIHPSILTERGLGAAEALATRSPIAVELGPSPRERVPASVEATAYFVVAEALTNAAKHARCERTEVSLRLEDEWAIVQQVRDDGVGGARASAGSGLRGLADRVNALGGVLEIESSPGRVTAIDARLSLAPRSGEAAVANDKPASVRQRAA